MLSQRLRQFIKLERWLSGTLGILVGLLLSVASDWLVQQQKIMLIWIIFTGVIILVVILWGLRLRHPFKDIDVAINAPKVLRDTMEYQRSARRGFVCFTPLYRPHRNSPAAKLSSEKLKTAIENRKYELLDIEQSNLHPTIQAITTHASKLKHCWLITTEGKNSEESTASIAHLLARYLREHNGLKCKFHISGNYNIRLDDDGQVLSKTYAVVKSIFEQAARLKLPPQDMIVDFTTGMRSMTLGMILASLNGDRDIEFMGTHYDKAGLPIPDELFPIIFSFEPLSPTD